MTCWWRIFVEARGATGASRGSWKRRAANYLAAQNKGTRGVGSYPKQLLRHIQANAGTPGLAGNHARRVSNETSLQNSGAESMARNGVRAPLT